MCFSLAGLDQVPAHAKQALWNSTDMVPPGLCIMDAQIELRFSKAPFPVGDEHAEVLPHGY